MPPRAAKRKKLSKPVHESPTNGDLDKHEVFTRWAVDRGVEINGVKPAQLSGRGLGLVTTKCISEGERMLFVPEKAMFKPDIKYLKRKGLKNISPQAQLAISLMGDGEDGDVKLAPWKLTWPDESDFEDNLPLHWPDAFRELLPPSVDQPLRRQLDDFHKDSASVESYIQGQDHTLEQFRYAWCIVNSRSFHLKPPKVKAGLMVMCPFIDYMNHGPSGTTCNVQQQSDGYAVYADREYAAGEEVLATYGAHSNDKLLVHYGFVCASEPSQPNTDDDMRLDHLILPLLSEEVRNQLQDVGFLGAYALLPATNELCFKTQVAVRAKLLTCNEWEYFMMNGEDLAEDQSAAVDRFVLGQLVRYRAEALEKLREIAYQRDNGALSQTRASLLQTRWQQIRSAIDAFASQ